MEVVFYEGEEIETAEIGRDVLRGVARVLVDDTSRGLWQTYLLYRVSRPGSDYTYALGRTYAAALVYPIPRKLWPDKPPAKHKEAAEALWGKQAGEWGVASHRVLGIQGEMLLNFGPASIPIGFVIVGFAVRGVRRWVGSWQPGDSRLLFTTLLIPFAMRVLHGDSANLAIQLTRYSVTVLPLIVLSSRRYLARPRLIGD